MTQAAATISYPASELLQLAAIAQAQAISEPYPHIVASGALKRENFQALQNNFPAIEKSGFFPLNLLSRRDSFDQLIKELEGPEIAEILTRKLGIELRDKPRMITIRKWSAGKDGRIHNDSESKIATALLYLNEKWNGEEGSLRVLRSKDSFEDMAAEIAPVYGNFFAFRRTESSWHGHKPFTGERRVVQITWLRSEGDLKRKEKRGWLNYFLKKLLPFGHSYS